MGGIFGGGSDQRRARQQAERSEARARRQMQTSTEEAAREQQRGERTARAGAGRGDILRGRLGTGRPDAPAARRGRGAGGGGGASFAGRRTATGSDERLTPDQVVNPADRAMAGRATRQRMEGPGGGPTRQRNRLRGSGLMDARLDG